MKRIVLSIYNGNIESCRENLRLLFCRGGRMKEKYIKFHPYISCKECTGILLNGTRLEKKELIEERSLVERCKYCFRIAKRRD